MPQLMNVRYQEFRKDVKDKYIILWGAGKLASYYLQTFCAGLNVMAIIDRDKSLWGKCITVEEKRFPIISEQEFKELYIGCQDRNKYVLFITSTVYAGEIYNNLKEDNNYNYLECYMGVLLRDYCESCSFEFTKGIQKIPKKIHYCWFGGKEIPSHLKKYMESWEKYCPEYEIIRWDENNYDITKNAYMKEAYEAKKWGFVPDYARLDIIYNEGGVYLDTDVELLASLDRVLNNGMFLGFSSNFQIGMGVGFGAIKGHPLIKELRDYYDNQHFILEDGNLNLKTCYEYQHPILQKFGFSLENNYQIINDVALYPSEVFSPNQGLIKTNYTKNTLSEHHYEYSWANLHEKEIFLKFKEEVKSMYSI